MYKHTITDAKRPVKSANDLDETTVASIATDKSVRNAENIFSVEREKIVSLIGEILSEDCVPVKLVLK